MASDRNPLWLAVGCIVLGTFVGTLATLALTSEEAGPVRGINDRIEWLIVLMACVCILAVVVVILNG